MQAVYSAGWIVQGIPGKASHSKSSRTLIDRPSLTNREPGSPANEQDPVRPELRSTSNTRLLICHHRDLVGPVGKVSFACGTDTLQRRKRDPKPRGDSAYFMKQSNVHVVIAERGKSRK